jgi:hypothetical protein
MSKKGVSTVVVWVESTLYNKVIDAGKAYGLLEANGAVHIMPYRVIPRARTE